MLELRPNCECCDEDLSAQSHEAMICSFECTFCKTCAEIDLNFICPNCNGELTKRPTRVGGALEKYPASTKRILKNN